MNAEPYQSAREKLIRARDGDMRAREEIVRENTALVRYVVRRFAGRGVEYEDLFQYGCMGLIKAVDRFDPAYDVRFSTYAVPVIMGEIRRVLRDDGPIHVSRTIKDRARRIDAFAREYVQQHRRSPGIDEIAEALEMDRGDVVLAMNSAGRVRSLEEPAGPDGQARLMDVLGSEPMADVDARLTLSKLIQDLSEEERALIVRRYFKRQTQAQIAREMGTSQVQVSRMEHRILKRMRGLVDSDP